MGLCRHTECDDRGRHTCIFENPITTQHDGHRSLLEDTFGTTMWTNASSSLKANRNIAVIWRLRCTRRASVCVCVLEFPWTFGKSRGSPGSGGSRTRSPASPGPIHGVPDQAPNQVQELSDWTRTLLDLFVPGPREPGPGPSHGPKAGTPGMGWYTLGA